jgi:hypothetical protein
LIVHAGATKTGSSAIQSGLALNYELLLKEKVCAPKSYKHDKAALGMTTTGNAKPLIKYGRLYLESPTKAIKYINDYFSSLLASHSFSTFVLSGEAVPGSISHDASKDLRDVIQNYFENSFAIYYVRDVVEHALSQYGEYIKRRGYRKPFSVYALSYKSPFAKHIRTLGRIFGSNSVRVLRYEDVRQDLWANFLDFVIPHATNSLLNCPPGVVNRSLCLEELEFVRSLNAYSLPRTAMTKAVVGWAHATQPTSCNKLKASKEDVESILSGNTEEITFVNSCMSNAMPYPTLFDPGYYADLRDDAIAVSGLGLSGESYRLFIERFIGECFGLKR